MNFKNRQQAGEQLAEALKGYKGKDAVIFALPRGGAVLGAIAAKKLAVPLDLLIPRKIGHPYNPEYAIGAVSERGELTGSQEELVSVDPMWLKQAVATELAEARRRRKLYLKGRKPISAEGKIAIIIDDGLATGLTMEAAIRELRQQKPRAIVVAVPVAPADTVKHLSRLADKVIALYVPAGFFGAIGSYYSDFEQVSDEQVVALLN